MDVNQWTLFETDCQNLMQGNESWSQSVQQFETGCSGHKDIGCSASLSGKCHWNRMMKKLHILSHTDGGKRRLIKITLTTEALTPQQYKILLSERERV